MYGWGLLGASLAGWVTIDDHDTRASTAHGALPFEDCILPTQPLSFRCQHTVLSQTSRRAMATQP